MSLKKGLILSVASIAAMGSVAAYAGGPDMTAAPACPVCVSVFTPFLYIGASAGWAYSDWNSFIASGLPEDADTNGFTYGGKIGYQFLDHFGIEGGGFVLPGSDQTVGLVGFQQKTGTVDSWFAYGAATIRAEFPGAPFFHIMGKVGGAYRAINHSGDLYNFFNTGDGDYATVLLGANLEYDLGMYNLPVALGVDYWYLPGSNDSYFANNSSVISVNAAPAAQIVVGTVSLRLAV